MDVVEIKIRIVTGHFDGLDHSAQILSLCLATQKGINYALATRATMTFSSSDQKTTFQTKEGERVLVSSTSVHKKLKILKESQRRVGFLGSYHTLGFYD